VVALSKAAVMTALDVGITPVGLDQGEAGVAIPAYHAAPLTWSTSSSRSAASSPGA